MRHEKHKVTINARFLTQKVTGVQRYAIELMKALDDLISKKDPATKDYSFALLCPPGRRQELGLKNIPIKQVGRFSGHLWEQFELPFYSRGGLLINLCNAAPLIRRNQMVTVHDAAVFANPENFSFLFRTWYRVLLKGLSRVAKRIITVSLFSESELLRWCGTPESKLRVTHEGKEHALAVPADDAILRKHDLERKPFVLAVSSASPNKNFRAVIRSLELLGGVDFDVVIAGGANPKVFGASAGSLPASVKQVGYVSDGELRALYEHAACFVYPSFYEGFGLPPLEAMACGCPVIVSDAASMPEICGDAALYCDPLDPVDIAGKIRKLIDDTELRKRLRQRGLRRAASFSWSECARETLSVIKEVTQSTANASTGLTSTARDRTSRRRGGYGSADSSSLNVLQVVGVCGGGLGRHLRALCRDLIAEGHTVTVAYAPHDIDSAFQEFVAERRGEIRFVPLKVQREIAPAADLLSVARLLSLVRSGGPFDVIHGHSAKGGAIGRVVGRLMGIPTVYTPHSLISSSPEVPKRRTAVYSWIERVLGHLATSKMIAVSQGEHAFALELGLVPKDRLVVIPNGIEEDDLENHRHSITEKALYQKPLTFGTTLRFSAQKAPVLLVEAFAHLSRTLPEMPMRLILLGDGELRDEVEARVDQSGVSDKIQLLGWRADTGAVLQEFDVFVLPSLYEGFSYSLLEAMAARLPVVSTEVFGAVEALSRVPGNVLVPPGDPRLLAQGMERAATMSEPETLRKTLRKVGEDNHEYVRQHFRQKEVSRRTIEIYTSLGATSTKYRASAHGPI